jgi:hypothetical protein
MPPPQPPATLAGGRRRHLVPLLLLLLLALLVAAAHLPTGADAKRGRRKGKKGSSTTCARLEERCNFVPGGGGSGGDRQPWANNDATCTLTSTGSCTCELTNSDDGSEAACEFDTLTGTALIRLTCPGGQDGGFAAVQTTCGPLFDSVLDPWWPGVTQNAYFEAAFCGVPFPLPANGQTQELYMYVDCAPRVVVDGRDDGGDGGDGGDGEEARASTAARAGGVRRRGVARRSGGGGRK